MKRASNAHRYTLGLALAALCAASWCAYARPASAASDDFSLDMHVARARTSAGTVPAGEYRSAWDEFGTSPLIDGNEPASQVADAIAADIAQNAQREVRYEQREYQYLESRGTTPEAVQAAEDAGGSDVAPQDYLDPQPSLDANPGVDSSSAADLGALSAAQAELDAAAATDAADSADAPTPLTIPPGGWAPEDTAVFESVLDSAAPAPDAQSEASDAAPEGNVAPAEPDSIKGPSSDASAPAPDAPPPDIAQ